MTASVNNIIIKEGYAPSKLDHIYGEFLIDGNNWIWIAIGGTHRFSVLLALNVDTIPVAKLTRWVTLFVQHSEVEFWPNVGSGLLTVEETLSIFYRIMKRAKYLIIYN